MPTTFTDMIERFQCPGCVGGSDTKTCTGYKLKAENNACEGHVLGTSIYPGPITFALGMPKGFNRGGICPPEARYHSKMVIRLFPATVNAAALPKYDYLNIPVWCHEQDGFLFVRVACPRRGDMLVDVYEVCEGRKATDICPQAVCVTDKMDEFD